MNIISEAWENPKLNEISKDYFIKLDRYLKDQNRSEYTINHYFSLLKSLFNYAIKKGKYRGENPVNEIKPYTVGEKRREYTPEELSRILEAAEIVEKEARKDAYMQKYLKRICLLLLYTGMRIGEVYKLKWENIKDDKIILKRTETKQKKEKVVPITESIRLILEDLRDKRRKDGYMLPFGKRAKKIWMTDIINKMKKYSEIEDFDFHKIRHTASTIMVSEALGRGVSIADIMKVLGHSRMETTLKYIHSDFSRMKKAVEILEEKTKKKD